MIHIRKVKGQTNEKCFLKSRGGCSEQISKEHYISHNLIKVINDGGNTIPVTGFHWTPKGKLKNVGTKNLVSNILCTKHNSDLSPLDSAVGQFHQAFNDIDKNCLNCLVEELHYNIDGRKIEQWLLKSIIGLIESKNIKTEQGEPYKYNSKHIKLLCNPISIWPKNWGLYVETPSEQIHHAKSFELTPIKNPETNEVLALRVRFNGFGMILALAAPSKPEKLGIHRPTELRFICGDKEHVMKISWPKNTNAKARVIKFEQIGKYSGFHPEQRLEII